MDSSQRVGVVSTMKGPEFTLESWLLWHGSLGIRHFYIFFDDPKDSAIAIAERYQAVYTIRIFKNDEETNLLKQSLPSYNSLKSILATEVPARQQLNADFALGEATKDGVDWLLHLDADELFYLVPPMTLQEHFAKLKTDNVGTIVYMNYEGVPEQTEAIGDYFHEVTLFKKNMNAVPISSDILKAADFWRNRTKHKQYMISYDNGKAATRVVDGVQAAGVHAWKIAQGNSLGLRNVSSLADVRTLDLSKLYKCNDAIILHFVVCGLYWYIKKYKVLDAFSNSWFGGQLPILPCFHLDSRDRFLSGDFEKMREAYKQEVLVDDAEVVQHQIEVGLCTRVNGISDAIKAQHLALFNEPYNLTRTVTTTSEHMARDSPGVLPADISTTTTKDENLPLEKMWVLSSLVSQYITPK